MTNKSIEAMGQVRHMSANQGEKRRWDWRQPVFILVFLILIYQVVLPFVMIVWTSFKTMRPGEAGFLGLGLQLDNYVRAFGDPLFWSATWQTLGFARRFDRIVAS